jgi:hypothetical protein
MKAEQYNTVLIPYTIHFQTKKDAALLVAILKA